MCTGTCNIPTIPSSRTSLPTTTGRVCCPGVSPPSVRSARWRCLRRRRRPRERLRWSLRPWRRRGLRGASGRRRRVWRSERAQPRKTVRGVVGGSWRSPRPRQSGRPGGRGNRTRIATRSAGANALAVTRISGVGLGVDAASRAQVTVVTPLLRSGAPRVLPRFSVSAVPIKPIGRPVTGSTVRKTSVHGLMKRLAEADLVTAHRATCRRR